MKGRPFLFEDEVGSSTDERSPSENHEYHEDRRGSRSRRRKGKSWLESSSEGNVESGFPSCGGDRSRKCKLAVNGRESQPPRQIRDTRGCNDVDCSWMMRVPERRCGAPCSTRGFVCRGNSRPPRANKRDERRRLRPSRLGLRSRRASPPPRHQARVWPGTFVVLRGEEGRGHGGSDGRTKQTTAKQRLLTAYLVHLLVCARLHTPCHGQWSAIWKCLRISSIS